MRSANPGAAQPKHAAPQTNLWICYILDKHFAGPIDAATLSDMPEDRTLLNRVLEGAEPLLPAKRRAFLLHID